MAASSLLTPNFSSSLGEAYFANADHALRGALVLFHEVGEERLRRRIPAREIERRLVADDEPDRLPERIERACAFVLGLHERVARAVPCALQRAIDLRFDDRL